MSKRTDSPEKPTASDLNTAREAFLERLTAILPEGRLASVLEGLSKPTHTAFRVNTLKTEIAPAIEALESAGLSPSSVSWSPFAFTLPIAQRAVLVDHPLTVDGSIYIQSLSSQLAVAVLDPQPSEQVLDLCAAPGGKTLAIAQCVGDTPGSFVSAVESSKPRFYRMKQNLQRGNAAWVRTYRTDGRSVGRKTPGRFDRVLVDAPCSAETAIDPNDPESLSDWSMRKIERCAKRQVQLLLSAIQATRAGGEIVYSTCTLAPEENEQVLNQVVKRLDGQICIEKINMASSLSKTVRTPGLSAWRDDELLQEVASEVVRLLPADGFDVFFLAKLRKV